MKKKIKSLKIIYKGEDKYIERIFEDGTWDEIPAPPLPPIHFLNFEPPPSC